MLYPVWKLTDIDRQKTVRKDHKKRTFVNNDYKTGNTRILEARTDICMRVTRYALYTHESRSCHVLKIEDHSRSRERKSVWFVYDETIASRERIMNEQLKVALRRCTQLTASGDAQTGFEPIYHCEYESLPRCFRLHNDLRLFSFINDRSVAFVSVLFSTIGNSTRISIADWVIRCKLIFYRLCSWMWLCI